MKLFGIVYLIVDLVNGKMYVGQTTHTLKWRFSHHARCKKTLIGQAIHEHKRKNFTRHVLKECTSRAELNAWEMFFIAALKTKAPLGYNCTDGGEGTLGCIFTPESRAKNSLNHLGEKNSFFGKHHTVETRLTISTIHRGKSPYKNLLRELDEHRLTYTALAKLLGVNQQNVSRKILAQRNFTIRDTVKLVEVFRKPIDWLLARDDGETTLSDRKNSPYKNLLRELEARGLLFADLAKILGVSKSHITSRMSGKKKFTERDAAKLVEFFDKPIEYLLTRDDGEFALAKRKSSPYKNLVAELKARGFLYADLAKILGLSKYTINSKMHGEVRFTARDKAKLVEFFDKPIEYLLARDDA